ncbi:MAG: Gfo/Idh/MocA family oxidoreductase [Acidimicrobiia bacterium]|nr:Gfo/Idh/MocA family oxidoreductase [Acidimicrobiia bacterium]
MTAPLRYGLVGAGGIGAAYTQVFAGLEEARLDGIADTDPDRAASAAAALGCASYPDHLALTGDVALDAVIVATPPSTHIDIARDLVDRGVAVLVEKPFAIHPDEARELVAEADRAGVQVTMASKFRYVDDIVQARRLLDAGQLGEPIVFENSFVSRVEMAGRWNSDAAVSGGGVLIDNGTHSVDVARYLLGPVVEVGANEGKRVQGLGVEDTAQLLLKHHDGALGSVTLSWSFERGTDVYVGVYGTEGAIEIGWKHSRRRDAGSREWITFGSGYDKISAMRDQVVNFSHALLGRESLLIAPTDAVASVDVIAAAYRSMDGRHPVPVCAQPAVTDGGASPGSQVA